jgi:hypothetical protein
VFAQASHRSLTMNGGINERTDNADARGESIDVVNTNVFRE